ncbi:MAG: hypothetical protein OER90_01690 [Gemmatimonadota bacterium]|nr:hypothetical protein [Gemmatimonadota bacterium]
MIEVPVSYQLQRFRTPLLTKGDGLEADHYPVVGSLARVDRDVYTW